MYRMVAVCSFFLSGLLGSLISPACVHAAEEQATIHVGSPDAPAFLQALEELGQKRAAGELRPVTIEIPAGTYRFTKAVQLTPELVGHGLTLHAVESGKVVFSGGRELPSGRRDGDVFRYSLPEGWQDDGIPRALVVQGTLQTPARHPNAGYFRIEKALPDRRSGFTSQSGDIPAELDLSAGTCDLVLLHDWSSSRLPVASWDAKTRELKTVGPIGCSAPHYAIDHFEKQPRYWLEGHPKFADIAGEWFIDRASNEVVLLASADGTSAPKVVLPRLTEILIARGHETGPIQNLTIQGIVFTESRFPMPPGGLAGAQATMHEPRNAQGERTTGNRPMLPAAVFIEQATNCRFQQCEFQALGGTALWLAGRTQNCQVQRCRFQGVGGNALNMGEDNSRRVDGKVWYQSAPDQVPTGNRVSDCDIGHCGRLLLGAVGIWAPLNRELEIAKNSLHDCPYTGISLGWIWNPSPSPAAKNRIAGNRIEFVMQVLSDGGGIYTLGRQPESIIEENVITDVPLNAGRAESNGMFLDEGTTGFLIRNNIIRRVDRSPLRFHQAGENVVSHNHWELATPETPPVRFNSTPEENIRIVDNEVLAPQKSVYLIGNSLTWDTLPPRLDGNVHWHVDCGKSLQFIHDHPEHPCVGSSRLWPTALTSTQFDSLSVQPHYGTTLEQDVEVIARWMDMQPQAVIVLHTGWPRSASLVEERADADPAGPMTHGSAYFDALRERLQQHDPDREIRSTYAMQLLWRIADDIDAGQAPFDSIETLYRDAIHMTTDHGRYLMHNAMRHALGQPISDAGFDSLDPELKTYLDRVIDDVLTPIQKP